MRKLCILSIIYLINLSFVYGQNEAGPDKATCEGEKVQIGAPSKPGWCYVWDKAEGLTDVSLSNPEVNPTKTTVYKLTVIGPDFSVERTDEVTVTVVKVEKIQYMVNGSWKDVPAGGLQKICLNSNAKFKALLAPGGGKAEAKQLIWGGAARGTGEEQTVTFSSAGATTVTVSCGKSTQSVPVAVEAANANVTITWPASDYSTNNSNGDSETTEKPFTVEYMACADVGNNVWKLMVKKITGGANILVRTGGNRDPFVNPPVSEAEARDAVRVMKAYHTNGGRGAWHTEAASKNHEEHHYKEWKCSSEQYWPDTEACLEQFTVPYDAHATEASALAALRALGAAAKITSFRNKAHQYWFTLADNAGSRPYAAGQLALNAAIIHVQNLATAKGWTVPAGVNTPSDADPCYQPWLPFTIIPCP